MALNPKTIQMLLGLLEKSSYHTVFSILLQIFDYLDNNIKDNQIFEYYEAQFEKWGNWTEKMVRPGGSFAIPGKLDDAKSLAYTLYRIAAKKGSLHIQGLAGYMFSADIYPDKIQKFNETFFTYFRLAIDDIIQANPEIDDGRDNDVSVHGKIVFVIHGHDDALKNEVLLFLSRGGVNSFALHEKLDLGRTIFDKFIEETKSAGYAIALLTPDDVTTDGMNRARQNVLLEIGYFIGKLGKSRVRLLVKGDIEIPSDLHGILYQKYDVHGAWKTKLAKEIQAVGIYVDIAGI